jgi:hypothetical protein
MLDPDRALHQFADDKQTVWNMRLFEHFFKVLSLYLEARILIRIRIKVTIWIRIRINVMRIRYTASELPSHPV